MASPRLRADATTASAIQRVDFVRAKHGRELLVDVGWIRNLNGFFRRGRPHWLSFYDVMLVTRGRGWFWLDERPYPVRPGCLYFTSPGQVRRWQAKDVEGLCLFFTEAFVSEFFHDALFLHRLRFFHNGKDDLVLQPAASDARRILAQLSRMEAEMHALAGDSEHLLRARLYELLVTLNRWFGEAADGEAAVDSLVAWRFRQLVEARFRTLHRVADYAALLAITPGHLNALAKRHLGSTAGEVVRGRLVVEARRLLLHTDAAVAQIARGLGFDDPAYFARFFRRETGTSPSRHRAAIREKYPSSR